MTTPGPLDLTPCPGCGFTSSGISAGCAECARRHPERYARWAAEMSDELDHLRARLAALHEVRVTAVVNWRRQRVHGITADLAEAQRWVREIVAEFGGDPPVAASMCTDVVRPGREPS